MKRFELNRYRYKHYMTLPAAPVYLYCTVLFRTVLYKKE